MIAQGSKDILLGADIFRYDPAHYLISTMQLPLAGEVIEASPEWPYLSFRLVLDPSVVTSVMVESGLLHPRNDGGVKAVDVSPLDADLLDATVRLESRELVPGTSAGRATIREPSPIPPAHRDRSTAFLAQKLRPTLLRRPVE